MSDELIVSGGGSVAVSSDEVLGIAMRLSGVARDLDDIAGELRSLSALHPERASDVVIAGVARRLAIAADCAQAISSGMQLASIAYGSVDDGAERLVQQAAAVLGWTLGASIGGVAILATPVVAPFVVGLGLAALARPEGAARVGHAIGETAYGGVGYLSETATVEFLAIAIASIDDAMLGAIGVNAHTAAVLGDEGAEITGLDTVAALAAGIASRISPGGGGQVALAPVRRTVRVSPPDGIADRVDRIPGDAAQIRIDRYDAGPGRADGVPRFEVYLGGTRDFSLQPGAEPWDMTSNVRGVAGVDADSVRAVQIAMADAGITADTPVVFTGYSQGGLIAARLASMPEYSTRGLVTVGAPSGQVRVPAEIPSLIIEHTDDLVPVTGGVRRPGGTGVVVARTALSHRPARGGNVLPAHALAEYQRTATLSDAAIDPRVVRTREALAAVTPGSVATTSVDYRAVRVGAPKG